MKRLHTLWRDECGQDMAEYAVLIGFVALTVLVAMMLLGDTINTLFNHLGTSLEGAASVEVSAQGEIEP